MGRNERQQENGAVHIRKAKMIAMLEAVKLIKRDKKTKKGKLIKALFTALRARKMI